jgi:hypothetical protein
VERSAMFLRATAWYFSGPAVFLNVTSTAINRSPEIAASMHIYVN